MANISVLHYDGVVTGSKELRKYNELIVSKRYTENTEKKPMTKVMNYFENYDNAPGGKKKEPFFDGFLVHMALLQKDSYKKYGLNNINYWPIRTEDIEGDNTGENSTFRSSRINESGNETATTDIKNYDKATHIFILSPLTRNVLEILIERINYAKDNREYTLIFHIQGDVIKAPDGAPRYDGINPDSGMTGGGSMFGEAFNLFSGGMEFQKFRNKLKEVGAEFYSVSPNTVGDADDFHNRYREWEINVQTLADTKAEQAVWEEKMKKKLAVGGGQGKAAARRMRRRRERELGKEPVTATEAEQKKQIPVAEKELSESLPIPDYYKKVNDDIIQVCSNNDVPTDWSNNFRKLNIDMIIQDGTDKDNLASMSLLGNMNQSEKIPVYFVGARMYKSSSRPFGTPKEAGGATFKFPESFERFRVNPNTQECEKPTDTRNFNKEKNQEVYGNFEFLKDITVSFYKHQMNGFKECLYDVMPSGNSIFDFIEGGIVDGTGDTSLSLRAPFNMSLFFFAPNTYMSSFKLPNMPDIKPWYNILKGQPLTTPNINVLNNKIGGTRKGGILKKKRNNKTKRRSLKNKTKRKNKTIRKNKSKRKNNT